MDRVDRKSFEENLEVKSSITGWLILILFSVLILGWGMFIMMCVPKVPRDWDFGALPDTPGISAYSTKAPVIEKQPPRQFAPLPEGTSWNRKMTPASYW
jgi:hypothetical protein